VGERENTLTQTAKHWNSLVNKAKGKWMSVVKYKLAAYFAEHTHQKIMPLAPFENSERNNNRNEMSELKAQELDGQLPIHDIAGQLLCGRGGRFMRLYLLRASPEERLSFLDSILKSKKGMPRPKKREVDNKVQETFEKLTGASQKDSLAKRITDYDPIVNWRTCREELRRTVRELFRNQKYHLKDRIKAFFPSTSANYIYGRDKAGAVGAIMKDPTITSGLRRKGGYLNFKHTTVDSVIRAAELVMPEEIQEHIDSFIGEPTIKRTLDLEEFEKSFATMWYRILAKADREETGLAMPHGLPEALKVRVITKGGPFEQTALKPLQMFMHRIIRNHRVFGLTGFPENEQYVSQQMGAEELEEDEYYLSGDYEAATDNIQGWASECVAEAIADEIHLSEIERRLFLRNLTGSRIQNPQTEEVKNQTKGQLMGAVTSFPILCIINAAACRQAKEITDGKVYRLTQLQLMINGDDVGTRTTELGYRTWGRVTRFYGLTESVGKTYLSKEFVNINSTNYMRLKPEEFDFVFEGSKKVPIYFKQLRAVNMGLMNGLKRSGGKVGATEELQEGQNLGSKYRHIMKFCPHGLEERAHAMFMRKNAGSLKRYYGLPYHIPEWLGGAGLTGYIIPSELDLRLAQTILGNWKVRRPIIPQVDAETSWKTWQIAERGVPVPVETTEESEGTLLYNKVVACKCVDLLFDTNVELDKLFITNQAENTAQVNRIMNHNRKLWNISDKWNSSHLSQAIDYRKLDLRSSYKSYMKREDTVVGGYNSQRVTEVRLEEQYEREVLYNVD
jgi:hypothetical protein